jgi:Fur family iron response transcriptional regulator
MIQDNAHMIRSPEKIISMLRSCGITPTSQRVEIAQVIFSRCEHLCAEEVFVLVNAETDKVSKATVYNTLGLFAERGLIREVIADPTRVFYDPNIAPHHHFYDVSSGRLHDIPVDAVQIGGLPSVPEGMKMDGVDVIIRVRPENAESR